MSRELKRSRIGLAADHRGFHWKQVLRLTEMIEDVFIEWEDVGTYSNEDRTDYSIYVEKLIKLISEGFIDKGIIFCGSGIGASIIANRYKNIYAGLCWNSKVAQLAKENNNINILIVPADFIVYEIDLHEIVNSWFLSKFKG